MALSRAPSQTRLNSWKHPYPIVTLTSFLIVVVYAVLKKSLDRRTALFAALLLVFDPFFVGMSRLLITDGLHASFALMSILCLGLALGEDKWHWYALSGVSAALASLSKSPAFFALSFLVFILSVGVYVLSPHRREGLTTFGARLATWYGAMILSIFVFWPSMWVQPLVTLEFVLNNLINVAVSGSWCIDAGPLFYLGVILYRGTPLVIVGALVTPVLLARWLRRLSLGDINQRTMWLLILWGTVATYVLMFSLGLWKNDFYVLSACLAINILGAIGLVAIFETFTTWTGISGKRQQVLNIAAGLVVILQVILCMRHYPYYLSYFNPALGGGRGATNVIPAAVAHGEGLEQVFRYLNSKEDAEDLYVGNLRGLYPLERSEFEGHFLRYSPPYRPREKPGRHWAQLDYVVYYGPLGRNYNDSPIMTRLLASTTPEFVVTIGGVEYARVYEVPHESLSVLPSEVVPTNVTYENGLQLMGYRIDPSVDKDSVRQQVLTTVYWQAEEYCREDYQVVLRLRDGAYSVWATEDMFPACKGWENSWRNDLVMPEEHSLEVYPGTPPGSYTLEMIVLHRPNGQEMTSDSDWDGVLGTVELPSHPAQDVHSLDMEHEIKAKLADRVVLLGYNIAGGAQPGETLHLTLFWQAVGDLSESYKVFVHVVDNQGNLVAQKDSEPVTGFYPTTQWQQGEIVRDQYEIPFSDTSGAAASGLKVGMYLPETGERLPVVLSDGAIPENRAVSIP